MASIVTVVIASQPGRGFAGSRWTSPWGHATLLGQVVAETSAWAIEPGLLILGADAEDVLERVDPGSFSVLIDPEWADGESSSLQAGLDYLQQEDVVDAVLLVSGDMPLIPSGTADQLLAAHATGSQPAVVPKYRYARGRPIVVGSELWPLLLGIDGDTSVEAVLATHASMVSEVWIDHLPPPVIGTPDDLEKWAPRR